MTTFKRMAVLLALPLLSGCTDYVTPRGVVMTAANSLFKNNLKTFRKALTGAALEQYGNRQGMAELREALSGLTLSAGKPVVLSQVPGPADGFPSTIWTYSIEVTGRNSAGSQGVVLTATARCQYWELANAPAPGTPNQDPLPMPAPPSTTTVSECKVAGLQL
jgi:hypothetical protein